MRFLTDGESCVFFCDGCHKILQGEDQGEVVIRDTAQFAEDVENGTDDPSQCECLCRACLAEREEA
jgi:hypothetical protein